MSIRFEIAAVLARCYDRDSELAQWAVQWLDGVDGATAYHDRDEGWCLILDGAEDVWYADDGYCEVEIGHDAKSARKQYVEDGDWDSDDCNATSWITVCSYRKAIDYRGVMVHIDRESDDVAIEPDEPDCVDGADHDWQAPHEIVGGLAENPGVWGNGGGVIIHEACLRCGCGRTTDTWAQNPSNGVQGLTSTSYDEGRYADDIIPAVVAEIAEDMDDECH